MDVSNFAFGQFNGFVVNTAPQPPDAELTNLNWVAGAPVPMQNPVSPTRKGAASRNRYQLKEEVKMSCPAAKTPKLSGAGPQESDPTNYCSSKMTQAAATPPQQPKKDVFKKERSREDKGGAKSGKDRVKDSGGESKAKKPNCSYTSLIGMALMASEDGCLPVSEIYTYIEDEFPYFRSAPDGWKNSIRHNLSLNPAFRKVKDSMRWQGKKGFYWEVTPERRSSVEREVERYLRQEGKLRDIEHMDGTAPFPSCLHASIPTMPHTPCGPLYQFHFCAGTQPYYDLALSMQRHYPPPTSSLPPPPLPTPPIEQKHTTNTDKHKIPLTSTATVTLLDTDMSPSQFAGFSDPANSSASTALHDLFGLQLSSPKSLLATGTQCCSHVYTQPPLSTQVVDSCGGVSSLYVSSCVSTNTIPLTAPNVSSSLASDNHMMKLRKVALDQLTIPKEHCISTDQREHIAPSQFLNSSELLDRCMTLEECFGPEDGYGSNGGMEYCGELPLPPRAHAWMGREEERFGTSVKLEGQEWIKCQSQPTKATEEVSSPEPSPMGPSGSGSVGNESYKGERMRRRKRGRRVSSARRPTSQREAKRSNCQDNEEKKTDIQERDETEEDEGEDMLSHVYSDSEETMRASLFPGATPTFTLRRAGEVCMVEDGVYSPPPSDSHDSVFIPSHPRHEVY